MSSTINASTASGGGLVTSADASGILQLQTASVTALTIDGSQNVGIGTSSPSLFATRTVLDIVGPSSGNGGIIRLADAASTSVLQIFASTGSPLSSTIRTASASDLTFGTNTTERMRIDSSGNVGIGTSSPSSRLDIQGNTAGQFWASIKNTNAGASSIGGWIFGNDTYSDVGGVFAGSSGGGGFGGANSMNIGSWKSAPLAMFTNNTERMRIDSSGNVGIGTSSPTCKLNVYSTGDRPFQVRSGTDTPAAFLSAVSNAYLQISGSVADIYLGNVSGAATITTGGSERARIDSSGNLLVGTTASSDNTNGVKITTEGNFKAMKTATGVVNGLLFYQAGAYQGGLNYGNGGTSLATSSDQRLKENIVNAPSILSKITNLQVRSFDWIDTKKSNTYGFIAQEVNSIFPEAVAIGKDNLDGSINLEMPWAILPTNLIPHLVKAIQELKAIIDTQNARIEALEAK